MAHYDLSHGGKPATWPNVGFAMLPSQEVGPYEFMEASAHYRPTTFTINRHLWFGNPEGYYHDLDGEANSSPALKHFLRNLRANGGDLTTADTMNVITLPIDSIFQRLFIRNLREAPGFAINLSVWDKDGNVVHDFGSFDLTLPHLNRSNDQPPVYTENFIPPITVPSNAAVAAQAALDAAEQALADAEQALTDAQDAVADPGNPTPEEQQAIDEAQEAVDDAQLGVTAAQEALDNLPDTSGWYLGHNHELVMQFTSIPEGASVDEVRLIVAAEVNKPWLGAW